MMKSKKIFIMALSIAIISVISNGSVFAAPAEKYKVVDAFIYLNVFINIYLMDIITQKVFYQNIFLN
ncbi:unknown [Brachyspira sp. CAG:700]|nr:unknown [Brachyspira sp. CAG:700]